MTTVEARRRRERVQIGLEVLILAVVLALGYYQLVHVNPENAQTRTALCALRSDLESRITQTQSFLQHPQSFPEFNDPKILALTRQQMQGQQQTVATLSILDCG